MAFVRSMDHRAARNRDLQSRMTSTPKKQFKFNRVIATKFSSLLKIDQASSQ